MSESSHEWPRTARSPGARSARPSPRASSPEGYLARERRGARKVAKLALLYERLRDAARRRAESGPGLDVADFLGAGNWSLEAADCDGAVRASAAQGTPSERAEVPAGEMATVKAPAAWPAAERPEPVMRREELPEVGESVRGASIGSSRNGNERSRVRENGRRADATAGNRR